ncbi:MAG: hypothetical protein JW808_07380 [Victivallales bacterium]|nr:hypothetical protein [Victivallales bacterium]
MTEKSRKILMFSAMGLAVACLAIAAALYLTYLQASSSDPHMKLSDMKISPSAEDVVIGNILNVSVDLKLPWGHHPENVSLTLPEGLQIVSEPKIEKTKTRWGKNIWRVSSGIQPYRTGDMQDGECIVTFYSSRKNSLSGSAKSSIPGFHVHAVDTQNRRELDLASEVALPKSEDSRVLFSIAMAILALAGAIIFMILILRKRRHETLATVLSPWEQALEALRTLRDSLGKGEISGPLCLARLTDIVRRYIERRYVIPATAQTTHEFLSGMDKGNSPLDKQHRSFLREFLTASDLVKFARFPADKDLVGNALCKAEDLILSTVPKDDETNGKECSP